jgi:hypothetical protein
VEKPERWWNLDEAGFSYVAKHKVVTPKEQEGYINKLKKKTKLRGL